MIQINSKHESWGVGVVRVRDVESSGRRDGFP
jgi:hypothetical protein